MKIVIATYFFHPEANPRAFRAYELAKEFARQGHQVIVYARATRPDGAGEVERLDGFVVRRVAPGFLLNRTRGMAAGPTGTVPASASSAMGTSGASVSSGAGATPAGSRGDSFVRRLARGLLETIYLGGFTFEYAWTLRRALVRHEDGQHDMLVSIGLPIGVHVGVAAYRATKRARGIFVADYGDPFSKNAEGPGHRHYRAVERAVLRRFDRVTVPLADAIPAYEGLVDRDRIAVIPQGVDLRLARRQPYVPGPVIRFCYSGVFYREIRNPRPLFEALLKIQQPFVFTLFTDFGNAPSMALLAPYREALGERLVLRDLVPRAQCIEAMSGFDFLVNQRNASGVQAPSKLIDYAMAGRPIFSFDHDHFDESLLRRFFARDFRGADEVDLSRFDVRTVATDFAALTAR